MKLGLCCEAVPVSIISQCSTRKFSVAKSTPWPASKYIPVQFNSTELTFFKFIQIFDICLLLFLFVFCQAVALCVRGSIGEVLFVVWHRVSESSSCICCEGGGVPCQLAENETILSSHIPVTARQLTIPVPRPMNRFWKYLQGEVHIAFFLGQANCARQLTKVRSHSHSWWEHRLPWLFPGPTWYLKWEFNSYPEECYRNKVILCYISTCRGQSRVGCTLEPCRRSWCSTSHASCSTWNVFNSMRTESKSSENGARARDNVNDSLIVVYLSSDPDDDEDFVQQVVTDTEGVILYPGP